MTTIGLVRVTVAAPQRRVDIALPEHAPVAEYAAALLSHAGQDVADEGAEQGGWSLHRADGTALNLGQTLAAQQVHDGEVLHLVPAGGDWPECEYDDLVDAIAGGAARRGSMWDAAATRRTGLGAALVALGVGLAVVLRAGPSWSVAVSYAGAMTVLLLLAGVVLARAVGDAGAGAVLGTAAMAHAAVAAALLPNDGMPLSGLGSPQLLAAGAALVLTGLAGYSGIVERGTVFVAATGAGVWAVLGAWLAGTWLGPVGAAAVVTTLATVLLPALAPLAMRFGRLPRPALPRTAADLLADEPQPPRPAVYDAVARADALLSGLLAASSLAVAAADVLLVTGPGPSPRLLVTGTVLALLLRARLLPVARHRVPLLAAGAVGVIALVIGGWHADPVTVVAPSAVLACGLLIAATLRYSVNRPGAYLGRYAEIAELLVVLTLIPLTCSVLGLYGRLHGMGG